MRSYHVKQVSGTPDWERIPVAALEETYLKTPASIRAFSQLARTDEELLVHAWIEVPQIRAVEEGPLGTPCRDSCLEFFFCPVPGDPRYLNLEFNPKGCMYLGFGTALRDRIRLLPREGTAVFSPEIRLTATGWEIFYRIPRGFVRQLMPEAKLTSQTLRGNFYACSDLSEEPYYLSWNRVGENPFTFHQSEGFGQLIL